MVTRYGSLYSYDLASYSSSKSYLAYVDIALAYLEGMVDYSTTLVRAYSDALIYSLVPLELDHVVLPLPLLKLNLLRWT